MAKLIKEITVITGTYTNKDGEEKNRYQRIGSVLDTKNGEMMKIDMIPLKKGGWDGWAYLNQPRDEQQQPKPQLRQQHGSGFDDMADDVPF